MVVHIVTVALYSNVSALSPATLQPQESYSDITLCEGTILVYNCSTYGNLPLTWTIRPPMLPPITHEFTDGGSSVGEIVDLGGGVSVVKTSADLGYLQSLLYLMVSMNQTWSMAELECRLSSSRLATATVEIEDDMIIGITCMCELSRQLFYCTSQYQWKSTACLAILNRKSVAPWTSKHLKAEVILLVTPMDHGS